MLELLDNPVPELGQFSKSMSGSRQTSVSTAPVVDIIGAASGLGALDQGCALGPDVLRRMGLADRLREQCIPAGWDEILRRPVSNRRSVNAPLLKDFCTDLAGSVLTVLRRGHRFIVVGGDHSCAIGTWSAASVSIRDRGPLGLVWIDAHMDSHTPQSSPSGAAHGMPLACLLGHGAPDLIQLLDPSPKLDPNHVGLVGVRSYEEKEARLLKQLGVRVIAMNEVHKHGLAWAINEALRIACKGTAGYGVSIDLDAVDPKEAPGVGTPVPDGLHGEELADCLRSLPNQPAFLGIEIAEFNPLRDQDDRTARLVCDLLTAGLARSR